MRDQVGIEIEGRQGQKHTLVVDGWVSADEGFEIRSIVVEAHGRRRDITSRFNALHVSDRWEFRNILYEQWVEEKRADYMTGDPRF